MAGAAHILIFDSGVGGLTVLKEIRRALPETHLTYVADNAGFPYGAWDEGALVAHIVALFERLIGELSPDICVIACNTASTLVLPALRDRFDTPFVGTVPAIKPAAERTKSGLISVLATPGTVRRDYTNGLIRDFAGHARVTLVGAEYLAGLAEAKLAGHEVDRDLLAREIAPAFNEEGGRRTDHVVLACTHYPLLLDDLAAAAPWPVEWVDPAEAIARRVAQVLGEGGPRRAVPTGMQKALFTAPLSVDAPLRKILAGFDLETGEAIPSLTGPARSV
jgi:glutamate racemase